MKGEATKVLIVVDVVVVQIAYWFRLSITTFVLPFAWTTDLMYRRPLATGCNVLVGLDLAAYGGSGIDE